MFDLLHVSLYCGIIVFDLVAFQVEIIFTRDGGGLGISIAGGKGSTPYKGNDEVR